jgi:hypothetical protein
MVAVTPLLAGVCVGLALLVAGGRRSPPLRRRWAGAGRVRGGRSVAPGAPPVPGAVLLDLVAEVVAGGASAARAVAAVGEALRAIDDPQATEVLALAARLRTGAREPASRRPASRGGGASASGGAAGDGDPGAVVVAALEEALDLALATGAGPVALLRAAARQQRRDRAVRGVLAARRLGVLVLLPTTLCLLPAFTLLTVVPLAIGLALG